MSSICGSSVAEICLPSQASACPTCRHRRWAAAMVLELQHQSLRITNEVTMPEAFPWVFPLYFLIYKNRWKPLEGYLDTFPSLTWQSCQKLSCPLGTVKQLRKTSATQKVMVMVFPQCIPPFSGETLDNPQTSFLAAS